MVRILLSNKLGELKWTQADLARKTGIRASTINEWYHEIVVYGLIALSIGLSVTVIVMWIRNWRKRK